MRLSFSIMLLVAAAAHINAAVTPNAAVSKCIAGSSGKGNGDGYNGYCCKDQSDCLDDCRKGVCNGPAAPSKTTSATKTKTSTKTNTATATATSAPGSCIAGSAGLGNGDGYKGYCCKDQSDCLDDCRKGVCNGPAAPSTSATNTKTSTKTNTKTTATATTTASPGACTPGSAGLGNGDGYKGYCCKDQSDCRDDCRKGVCNGPAAPSTTATATNTKTSTKTTATATTTASPGACTPGSAGLGNGDGYKGYCCKDQSDCRDDCRKGVCNGPAAPSTTATATNTKTSTKTTATATATASPGACTPGSAGLGNGDGYKGYCCKDQSDCLDDCRKGVCNGPAAPSTSATGTKTNTKTKTTSSTATATATSTPGSCTPGSAGLGNGDGYNGACCKDQSDCIDDCRKGVCNGPVNTKTATKTTTKTKTNTKTATKTKTDTKTKTKTTSTKTATATPSKCIPGSAGKGNGDGELNACCKSSDDCKNSCKKGKCNAP